MFTAKGVGVVALAGGLFQVTVNYIEDETQKILRTETYVIANKPALQTKVVEQLQLLRQAALDAQLNIDIAGKTLGTI